MMPRPFLKPTASHPNFSRSFRAFFIVTTPRMVFLAKALISSGISL